VGAAGLLNLGSGSDASLGRQAAANIRQGAADAASPVAQTFSVQSVVAGTSNTAGAVRTYSDSSGTGTGASGGHVFTVAPAGSTGTAQNAQVTALTISNTKAVIFAAQARLKGYTVGTLPAGTQGDLAFATDCLAPTFNGTATAGGSVVSVCFYNGSAWVTM